MADVSNVTIYEDEQEEQRSSGSYDHLMTPEQKKRGQRYSELYFMRRAEVDKHTEEWDELFDMYACRRENLSDDPNAPCNFIALITPNVEGQTAAMAESTIEFRHLTNNPGHEKLMLTLDAASDYVRRKNKFNRYMKDFIRWYDLIGNCWLTIVWEDCLYTSSEQPDGYPRLMIPEITDVIVDGKIKDAKDLQLADYIIHRIKNLPMSYARKRYGDEKADAIPRSGLDTDGPEPDISMDDTEGFNLLHVWTRDNEERNLQLIEMTEDGFVLEESDSSKPYFTKVYNEYPFAFARMIPQQGSFYGIGDGRLLIGMQKNVNKLTDEFETAARFNAQPEKYIDPKGEADPSQFTTDPSGFRAVNNPRGNIFVVPPQGISNVVPNMIEFELREAQRVTRFADIMTGNMRGSSATATQINTQMQQGYIGINDKKSDIADVMAWADAYCLRLCLEKWTEPFWAKFENTYQSVDMPFLQEVPATIPTKSASALAQMDSGVQPQAIPKFETISKGSGMVASQLDFDVEVVLGQGIPKGRIDMFNMIVSMLQLVQQNPSTGEVQFMLTMERAKEIMEQIVGFRLDAADTEEPGGAGIQQAMKRMQDIMNKSKSAEGQVQMPLGSNTPTMQQPLAGAAAGQGGV